MALKIFVFAAFGAVPLLGLLLFLPTTEIDRSVAARPGDQLQAVITLGSGFSFDKGSVEISSHEKDEVRLRVEARGWGQYAVDFDIEPTAGGVRVDGEVEGFMHWMFGGPTVNARILVPEEYSVKAEVIGGRLEVEQIVGTVEVSGGYEQGSMGDIDIRVQDTEGPVHIVSQHGPVRAEDIVGRVAVETREGSVEIDDVLGDVEVVSERGHIEVEDASATVVARTERGDIDVEFDGDPAGRIETVYGSVEVDLPDGAAFDLDASVVHGSIHLDSDFRLPSEVDHRERFHGEGRAELAGPVNGGGSLLEVRTDRGSIEIDDGDWDGDRSDRSERRRERRERRRERRDRDDDDRDDC